MSHKKAICLPVFDTGVHGGDRLELNSLLELLMVTFGPLRAVAFLAFPYLFTIRVTSTVLGLFVSFWGIFGQVLGSFWWVGESLFSLFGPTTFKINAKPRGNFS